MDKLNIKQWMGLKEITIRELSLKSGVSQQTISNWRNGKSTPSWTTLQKITVALGIEIQDIIV